ncbi:MAG: extracellular solute-binding protein [Ruminococcaceae bacterium]|nr:extracellular solute-binding protein [Oscillospiraceae bacterium]
MKKKLSLLLSAVIGLTALTSCGETATQTEDSDTISYTLFAHEWQSYDGAEHDRILKTIEEKFNVKLNLTGAPSEGWTEKLTLMINTGEVPDLFFFLPGATQYRSWVSNGIILPLDDYLDNTEYMKKIFEETKYKNLSYDGKHYFMPNVGLANSHAIYYRKDWLEKVGLQEPKTIEEFEEMLRRFTEEDPDGNGKDDTYGLSLSKVSGWLASFYAAFGFTTGWNKNDTTGEYLPYFMEDGYGQMLDWLSGMYQKGYIKDEYFIDTDQQKLDNFFSGQAGVVLANSAGVVDQIVASAQSVNPNAVVDVLEPPAGPGGEGGMISFGGYYGGWNISAEAKEPERLIQILDYLVSPEGQKLRTYGIEGVHYTEENGEIVRNDEECIKEPNKVFLSDNGKVTSNYEIGNYFSTARIEYTENGLITSRDYSALKNEALALKCDEISNKNLSVADSQNILDTSEEFSEIGSKMNDISEKYTVMIISGQLSAQEGMEKIRTECEQVGYKTAAEFIKGKIEQ